MELGGGSVTSPIDVSAKLTQVKAIYSTNNAFAALKEDGTVVAWGAKSGGGDTAVYYESNKYFKHSVNSN